jgi:TonB dependent receptor
MLFGVRVREQTEDSVSPANFNGTFTFTGGSAPQLNAFYQPLLDTSGQPILTTVSSIETYRRTLLLQGLNYTPTQIRLLGGGASQFSIAAGRPALYVKQFDISPFFGDDWKLRSNLTLSLGLRYETQTNISDRRDFAPRVAIAWAPGGHAGKPAKAVLRGGVGVFYDRFALSNVLTATRFNGLVQQQYVINQPDFFPSVPSISSISAFSSRQTIEKLDSSLRTPYIIQSALSIERQLPRNNTLALTYTNAYGLHLFRS